MARLPAQPCAPTRRLDIQAEEGFGIIEVLVSALIVVILSLGVFAAIDAAGGTAATNKARSAASNLATADQERLRSIPISTLTDLDETNPKTVDNRRYDIQSEGEYVAGTGESAQCASTEAAPKYLKITSTVTWPGMTAKPVKQDSLRAMPNGTVAGRGSAAVDIDDRNGDGVAGITVTLSGPETVDGTTNANGCVIFGFIPAGNYTVSFSQPGYVEAKRLIQNVSDPVVVAIDAIASASYQYDRASSIAVKYETTTAAGGSTADSGTGVKGEGFTIANALLGTPNFRTFSHGLSNTASATNLFPYSSDYEVWAGECQGARPPGPVGTAPVKSVTAPPGAASAVTLIREPKLRFQAVRRKAASPSTTTEAVPTNTPVVLRATGTGCSEVYTALVSGGFATFDVPYGSYTLCMPWSSTKALNRGNQTISGFVSNVAVGKPFNNTGTSPTVPVVPYGANTNQDLCSTS